jgi:nucleotide-binding universal stress UspA family protein
MNDRIQVGIAIPEVAVAGRPVLLATDGSPSAAPATRLAQVLAEQRHVRVHVLVALDMRRSAIPPPLDLAFQLMDEAVGPGVHAEQEEAVRRGIAVTLGREVDWAVRMGVGVAATAIVREANRIGAALIIMGLRRHSRTDRVLNDETTLNVIRTASCPVLGVAPGLETLPTRVLSAMDFTSASVAAVATARALTADGGTLTLAYVPPLAMYSPDDAEGVLHTLGLQAGFEQLSRALRYDGVTVDQLEMHHELKRPVSELLLECAESTSAQLIAAGSARPSRVDRWLLGSVSTDLVRDGRCSVLVVPPARKHG